MLYNIWYLINKKFTKWVTMQIHKELGNLIRYRHLGLNKSIVGLM